MPIEPATPVNPYQSPGQEPASQLPERHRTILEAYLKHRDQPPTVLVYLRKVLPFWLLVMVLMAVGAAPLVLFARDATASPTLLYCGASLLAGVFIGACARDIGWIRRVVATWPVMREVIDWEKIERLLKQ